MISIIYTYNYIVNTYRNQSENLMKLKRILEIKFDKIHNNNLFTGS
jgi:hypothetical protein